MRLNIAKAKIKKIYQDSKARKKLTPFLEGSPGIGKSAIVKQIAKELNIECKVVELITKKPASFVIPDPVDEKGFKEKINYSMFPIGGNGILFFDEFISAPQIVQAAAHDLILEKRLGDYELPEGWMIVLAGNRMGENIVNSLFPATVNRIMKMEVEYTIEDFNYYAIKNDYDPSIIGFFNENPHLIVFDNFENWDGSPFCSPRSIEEANNILKLFGKNDSELAEMLKGTIGDVAFDLHAYIQEEMPNYEDVLNGKIEWKSLPRSKQHYVIAKIALTKDIKKVEKAIKILKDDKEFTMLLLTMVVADPEMKRQVIMSNKIMKEVDDLLKIIKGVNID